MWRIGVLLAATALFEFVAADVKPTDGLLVQRLKRSPNSCDNYEDYPPRRPRYWPPPPPPAPPQFWSRPGPSPYWPPRHHRHRFEELSDGGSRRQEPCATCAEGNGNSSVSNAKSDSGDAIAVAVAKASPKS